MKKGSLFFVLAVFILFLALPYASADLTKKPLKTLPSPPSVTNAPTPGPIPILLVTAPAGGANWSLGSKYDITWSSSNISGYLRLDLYCDLPSPHKVGTITANTSVSNGKYNWEAGKYLGGVVSTHGKGYRIVFTATNPPITKSSPQFNLIAAASKVKPVVSAPVNNLKGLSFIYPRRADLFHKGISYTITWHSINLKDAMLKLELLDNQEQNVLQTIASNFVNTGSKGWKVSMNLPDEEKLYKIRLQTMDGTQKAIVGPIKISKGTIPPASLKVTNPIMGDRTFGDIIPVKWASTSACSGNGGPIDDGFRIELIKTNEQGTVYEKVMDLTDVGYVFVNEGPTGHLNWRWDWNLMRGSCQTGTYKIRVASMTTPGACTGVSEKFRIVDPNAIKEASLPATFKNRKHCHAERYDSTDQPAKCPQFPDPPPGKGRVGSQATYEDLGGFMAASEHEATYTHFRSRMDFPGLSFQHIRNRIVKKATLQIIPTETSGLGGYGGFCVDRLYALNGPWSKCMDMPVIPGFQRSVSTSQDTKYIDVTAIVKGWMSGSTPNHGFLLTNLQVFPAYDDDQRNRCWSYYDANLQLEFE